MNLNVDKNYVPEGVIEPTPLWSGLVWHKSNKSMVYQFMNLTYSLK